MGSFLNVIAFELEANVFNKKTEKSFWQRINRRSHCNSCGHKLEILDLFPVFSYIFTWGRCRHCGAKFSPRYLFVEIFSGIIFMGLFYKIFAGVFDTEFLFNFIGLSVIFSGLILIFLFDLKHKIIPDVVIYSLFILSILFLFLTNSLSFEILWHGVLTALPFWALYAIPTMFNEKWEWMGNADWKLVLLLSIFLVSFEQLYSFAILSFWYGAFFSVPLIFLSKKYQINSEIPFGPFILLSFWTVYIFDLNILEVTSKVINWFY